MLNECVFDFHNESLPRSNILVGQFGHRSAYYQSIPLVIVEYHKYFWAISSCLRMSVVIITKFNSFFRRYVIIFTLDKFINTRYIVFNSL